jgi:hypothetical protein
MKKLTLEEKINYLEKKFNAPMDVIMQAINFCKKNNLCITELEITDENDINLVK